MLGAGSEFFPPYPMGYGGKTRHLLYAETTISRQSAASVILSIFKSHKSCHSQIFLSEKNACSFNVNFDVTAPANF